MSLNGRNVLYISYTGLLEPLGQSQVYRYLRHLAHNHRITLITYEKPEDLNDTPRISRVRDKIEDAGITWYPLRYHRAPTLPATVYDLARGFATAMGAIRRNAIDVVHTRSYVPSVLGLLCRRVFGTAFVFDMRGFWADERVDGGLWEEDSRMYRVAKWFETQFLTNADVTISLTEAGIDAMREFDHVDTNAVRFETIPTCVDLDLFTPQPERREDEFVLGYVGSVGTWYRFDDVLECFEILREIRPDSRLLILNRDDHDYIRERVADYDLDRASITIKSVEHSAVPAEMNRMDAGIFFYTPTFSKKGTSPTKMGEFLACGIPCLSNSAVGDVESILEDEEVGVAIDTFSAVEKRNAIERMIELQEDPTIIDRCREVAESYHSLESGVRSYDEIYRTVGETSG